MYDFSLKKGLYKLQNVLVNVHVKEQLKSNTKCGRSNTHYDVYATLHLFCQTKIIAVL